MRLIEADCEINYDGRGSTVRGRGVRLLIFKDDGSFLIHRSTGVKPLNYMTKSSSITEDRMSDGATVITVQGKDESIDVVVYRKIIDVTIDMPEDPSKSIINGTERQFQEWLSRRENWAPRFGENTVFLARELKTSNGAIDLTGYDENTSELMIIEMKRRANKNDVYQVLRYAEALGKMDTNTIESTRTVLEKTANDCDATFINKVIDAISNHRFQCWLVYESSHDGVPEFCDEHDVKTMEIGSSWWGETAPLAIASKTAVSGKTTVKRKTRMKGLLDL